MFLDILSDFDVLWTTKERTNSSIVETDFLNVTGMFLSKPTPFK
jgi:hypothetical protein